MSKHFNFLFSSVFFIPAISLAAVDMGVPVQLRLKSPGGLYPTETGVAMKLQVLSVTSNCVLREENFSNQTLIDGSVSLTLGSGTRSGFDPALPLNQVFDNSSPKTLLSCIDSSGASVSTNQTYSPSVADSRTIRFSAIVSGDSVIADFPMKSVPYAIQAESVGGKLGSNILVQNPATQLNQANLQALLADGTKLANLQNSANGGTVASANSAVNFSGVLSGDISGAQTAVSVDKIKGITVSGTAPALGQVLQYNGSQYTPVAIPSAAVSSIAGRTGAVVLASGDISGLGTAAVLNAGTSANNLVQLDATAKIPFSLMLNQVVTSVADTVAATNTNAASTLVKRDASGNIAVNAVSSNALSTQGIFLYEASNTNRVQFKAPSTFSNYTLTFPTGTGSAGQILSTDGSGNLSWLSSGGSGTVTSITAGSGLSGGVITSSGIISLANTSVTAGSYGAAASVANFTVDAQGRLSSAASTAIALPTTQITQSAAALGQVLKWNGTNWAAAADNNSGGTVTNVTSGNSYLAIATATSTPVITANVGTVANTLASGNDARITGAFQTSSALGGDLTGTLPNPILASVATAGTATKITFDAKGRVILGTNLLAADVPNLSTTVLTSGILPVARGGTGATALTANALMISNGTGTAIAGVTCATNQVMVWTGSAWACTFLTALLDASLGSTQGSIAYRGAASWMTLPATTAGQFLQTNGAGANPTWNSVSTFLKGNGNNVAVAAAGAYIYSLAGGLPKTSVTTNNFSMTVTDTPKAGTLTNLSVTFSAAAASTFKCTVYTGTIPSTMAATGIAVTGNGVSTVLKNAGSVAVTAGSLVALVCTNTAGIASAVPVAYSVEYITP